MFARLSRKALLGTLAAGVLLAGGLLGGEPVGAQELPLKRDLPRAQGAEFCPSSTSPPSSPTSSQAAEATRLANAASQAQILGDQERARELLSEAGELDPTAQHIAYLLGRTLEDLGETEAAIHEYCRYLSLSPDPASVAEVLEALEALAPPADFALSEQAVEAFREGVEAFDDGRMQEAEEAFSRAVTHAADWAAASYNRGLARLEIGRTQAGLSDLRTYLELEPDAEDRIQVLAELGTPRPPSVVPGPSGGRVFLAGLIPGMGHFYTSRPVMGAFVLALAGGSAAAGVLHEERVVECRIRPIGDVCPPAEIQSETSERPYLAHALGAAAVITFVGALDAVRGARSQDAFAEVGVASGSLQLLPSHSRARNRATELTWLRFLH